MIEPRLNAFQIADAIVVRILERARIDLIDDSPLPPAMRVRHCSLSLDSCRRSRQLGECAGFINPSEYITGTWNFGTAIAGRRQPACQAAAFLRCSVCFTSKPS